MALLDSLHRDLFEHVLGFLGNPADLVRLGLASSGLRSRLYQGGPDGGGLLLHRLALRHAPESEWLCRMVRQGCIRAVRELEFGDFLSPSLGPARTAMFRRLLPGLQHLSFRGCVVPGNDLGGILPALAELQHHRSHHHPGSHSQPQPQPQPPQQQQQQQQQQPKTPVAAASTTVLAAGFRCLTSRGSGPVAQQLLELAPRLREQLSGLHLDWLADDDPRPLAETLLTPAAAGYPALRTLALVDAGRIRDWSFLRGFPGLTHLSLAGSLVRSSPEDLGSLLWELGHLIRRRQLRWLDLTHAPADLQAGVAELVQPSSLQPSAAAGPGEELFVSDLSTPQGLKAAHDHLRRLRLRQQTGGAPPWPEFFADWLSAVTSCRDQYGVPLLSALCSQPEYRVAEGSAVDFLLGLEPGHLVDRRGRGPMANACRWGQAHAVRSLLARWGPRAALDVVKTGRRESPLTLASLYGHVEVVRELLSTPELVALQTDPALAGELYRFDTPTTAACAARNLEVLRLLVDRGRVCLDLPDEYGQLPLHVAIKTGFVQGVEMLLKAGADAGLLRRNIPSSPPQAQQRHRGEGDRRDPDGFMPRWAREALQIDSLLAAHGLVHLAHRIRPLQESAGKAARGRRQLRDRRL